MTAAKADPADKFIREVMAGKHDLRIGDVLKAMTQRIQAGVVSLRWGIEWEGLKIREDDLTLGECFQIEEESGKPWGESSPVRFAGDLRAVLVVLCQTRLDLGEAEAAVKVGELKASEIAGCLYQYQVDRTTGHSGPLASVDSPTS